VLDGILLAMRAQIVVILIVVALIWYGLRRDHSRRSSDPDLTGPPLAATGQGIGEPR
jgi:cation transporter-like permease